jgi:hypothetical protein
MLRIETRTEGCRTTLRLIGRVRDAYLDELRGIVRKYPSLSALDLAELKLVDLQSVCFLRDCQDRQIELRNCSPYITEWIRSERAQGH